MRNYKDRIKHLISKLYSPGDVTDFDVKMSTPQIYEDLCSIIPSRSFDEFDVVEVLEDLNFFPGYEQKVHQIENEKGNVETIISDDLVFYWYMKKND